MVGLCLFAIGKCMVTIGLGLRQNIAIGLRLVAIGLGLRKKSGPGLTKCVGLLPSVHRKRQHLLQHPRALELVRP